MTDKRIDLRDKVLANVAAQGAVGAAWLTQLPELVRRLEDHWGLKVGQIFPNATEAYVAAAVTGDGEEVALKIPIPGLVKADRELRALQAADGRGYVRLLRHDATSGAMLLERLGPQLARLGLAIDEQIQIICSTLEQAWMPLPAGLQLITGAGKGFCACVLYQKGVVETRQAMLGKGVRSSATFCQSQTRRL